MKKVLTIVGARPQFIKAAAVSRAIEKKGTIAEQILHTGQHYDQSMSDVFFEELGIPKPKFNLGVGSGSHGAQTGQMLAGIEEIIGQQKPDMLLVYGDTNSTLAGALAASKMHVPVAHVEAGLRSFNRKMPEEINRVVCDHLSDLLFAPSDTAVYNLQKEGLSDRSIHNVGDVMYDAALHFGRRASEKSRILQQLSLDSKNYILVTVHRAENTDDITRLTNILDALSTVSETKTVVMPLHPRTRNIIQKFKLESRISPRVRLVDPVGYLDMVMLEQHSSLIATDSGGVQKEAFFFSVPCVTLRDESEWVETIKLGWNTLSQPVTSQQITQSIMQRLGSKGQMGTPYGDGTSCEKIVDLIEAY